MLVLALLKVLIGVYLTTNTGAMHLGADAAYKALCRHRTYEVFAKTVKKALKSKEGFVQSRRVALGTFRPHVCPVVGCNILLTTQNIEKRHIARFHAAKTKFAPSCKNKDANVAIIEKKRVGSVNVLKRARLFS